MRKIIAVVIVVLMFPLTAYAQSGQISEGPEPISAASAILIEPFSGRILYEKNAHQSRPIASTTKIMTALVAMEISNPEDVLCVQSDCVKIEGSSLYLEEAEQLTLKDMLYGLILRSGNDAAVAIGKHVAGDVRHFTSLMNRKAWELGMTDTNFVNPHGLDHHEHYSTAYDMARLGAAFLRVPLLREICITEEYVSRELTTGRLRLFLNNNKLLARDPRALGIKIGWTDSAGRCLVAAAKVGEMELIAVVLDAPDLYTDVSKLFDYGFANLSFQEVLPQGKVMGIVPVDQGNVPRLALTTSAPVFYPVFPGESVTVSVEMDAPETIQAPIQAGQALGRAKVLIDNCQIEVDIVAASDVKVNRGVWNRFLQWVKGWWQR